MAQLFIFCVSFFPFAFSYGNCQHVFITNFITFLLVASVGKFDFCRPVGRGQKKTLRRIETIVGLEGGGGGGVLGEGVGKDFYREFCNRKQTRIS